MVVDVGVGIGFVVVGIGGSGRLGFRGRSARRGGFIADVGDAVGDRFCCAFYSERGWGLAVLIGGGKAEE